LGTPTPLILTGAIAAASVMLNKFDETAVGQGSLTFANLFQLSARVIVDQLTQGRLINFLK
jgi:hypothetical protein